MALRVTGLASGLDTESIIAELVSANSYKVSSLQKEQTALSWKQEAWKTLNNKVYSFYTDTLSDLRFSAAYSTKKTTVSDSTYASVTAASTASNSVQYMSVEKLAKSGYLTGGLIGGGMGDFTKNSTLSEIDSSLAGGSGNLKLSIGGGEAVDINITGETTMEDIVNQIKETGLNANFDEANATPEEKLAQTEKLNQMVADTTINSMSQMYDVLNEMQLQHIENQLQNKLDAIDAEEEARINAVNSEILTEEHRGKEINAINNKYNKKREKAEEKATKEQAKINKRMAIIDATMSFANASMGIWSFWSDKQPIMIPIMQALLAGV